MDYNKESIGALVRRMQNDYINGTTTISKFVEFSQYDNVEKIEAYLNSKHVTGDKDSMGRDKPFFNIVTGATNIWYRATDIDRKNIRIKPTKQSDVVGAFLATCHLQDWMKKDAFGVFLNDWGRTLARYGSAITKWVQKDGRLHACVIPWGRMISDTVDFENNPKIERLFYTPAQLRKNKAYDQEVVKELLSAISARKTMDGQNKDNKNDYIEVYEVHGELPLSNLTEREEDCETYIQQMHVVSYVKGQDENYKDFTLLCGKEKRDPYLLTHLIREDGRAMGIGAVEHLFEAQWMTNHSTKAIKDHLDLASKLIFQTADPNFVGMNALTAIETGDIMIHSDNMPLTQLNNGSHDITSLQNFGQQWQVLAREITSTPEAITGSTMPSGTAYRQVAILNQEAHSLFEMMTENKGLAIEEMMREFILPYLKTKMDTTEEIAATLDAHGIKQIEMMYVNNEAIRRHNAKATFEALNGLPVEGLDVEAEKANISNELAVNGDQRFLKPSDIPTKTWKEVLKDLVWEVEVEVTNEQSDKEAVLTTLTTLLQSVATNPAVLQDPTMRTLFNKILQATGEVSSIELAQMPEQPAPAAEQVNGGGQAGGDASLPVSQQ